MPEIKLGSDVLFSIGSMPVTTSVFSAYLISLLLIVFAVWQRTQIKMIPGRMQMVMELFVGYFYGELLSAFGNEKDARRFSAYIMTLFIFILIVNQFSLLPLIGQIVTKDGINIYKTATGDWSLTLVLALISIGFTNLLAFFISPIRHIGNFIKLGPIFSIKSLKELPMAILDFFLGLLDIIGEASKVISLSARLLGNILAGEIMYIIIASLSVYTQFLLPMPFVALSIFSGLVQAYVFAFLSLQFMAGTIRSVTE